MAPLPRHSLVNFEISERLTPSSRARAFIEHPSALFSATIRANSSLRDPHAGGRPGLRASDPAASSGGSSRLDILVILLEYPPFEPDRRYPSHTRLRHMREGGGGTWGYLPQHPTTDFYHFVHHFDGKVEQGTPTSPTSTPSTPLLLDPNKPIKHTCPPVFPLKHLETINLHPNVRLKCQA